jgi:hypothetical protein
MKIRNYSQYNTSDLRKILNYALSHWWYRFDKKDSMTGKKLSRFLVVEIYNRKNGPCTASYNGYSLNLNLWNRDLNDLNNKRKFAWILRHEIEHLNGKHHKDMIGNYWNNFPGGEYIREKWVDDFQIKLKEVKVKPVIDLQETRYSAALSYVEKWKHKVKVATNRLRKYQLKARRYELVLANKRKDK